MDGSTGKYFPQGISFQSWQNLYIGVFSGRISSRISQSRCIQIGKNWARCIKWPVCFRYGNDPDHCLGTQCCWRYYQKTSTNSLLIDDVLLQFFRNFDTIYLDSFRIHGIHKRHRPQNSAVLLPVIFPASYYSGHKCDFYQLSNDCLPKWKKCVHSKYRIYTTGLCIFDRRIIFQNIIWNIRISWCFHHIGIQSYEYLY